MIRAGVQQSQCPGLSPSQVSVEERSSLMTMVVVSLSNSIMTRDMVIVLVKMMIEKTEQLPHLRIFSLTTPDPSPPKHSPT